MKRFNEKDVITWTNRHDVNVGDKGYFAHSIDDLDINIENGYVHKLINISNYYACCFAYDSRRGYGFFLPVDAVKKEKTYRACKNVKELYELIFNTKSKADTEFYINELVGTVIHFKLKGFDLTYYECITGIVVYNNGDIDVRIDGCNFELPELFKNYEIEINDKWQPFGVANE